MSRAQISLSLIYHCTDGTWKSESLKLRCSPLPVLRHIHWSFFVVFCLDGDRKEVPPQLSSQTDFNLLGCVVSLLPKKNSFDEFSLQGFLSVCRLMLYSQNTLFICIYNIWTYNWFTNYSAFRRGKMRCSVQSEFVIPYILSSFFYLKMYHKSF